MSSQLPEPEYDAASRESTRPLVTTVDEPAPQLAQATVDDAVYLPAEHAVHVLAPALVSVLVEEPGLQPVHAAFVVPALYVPAGQAEQVDAPVGNDNPNRVWPDAKFVATSVAERALL